MYSIIIILVKAFKYINCEDEHDFNRTSLHKAAQNGHKDVVELLISQGADVNATDMFGKMPIHFAAGEESKSSNLEIVKLLLEKGARLDKKDIYGNTPLDPSFILNPKLRKMLKRGL